jgi:hypothetical protein
MFSITAMATAPAAKEIWMKYLSSRTSCPPKDKGRIAHFN